MHAVIRRAYAKLNLALSVGPPFPPDHKSAGMHPIASWIHAIDLFDEIRVEHRPGHQRGASRRPVRGLELNCDWAPNAPVPSEMDWSVEEDLCARALRVIEGHIGEELPVLLHITKRIPIGSGLGGGSSNSAAVMLALNELFALGLPTADLARLSGYIGSDIAFFLDSHQPPRPALVTQTGTTVEHVAPAHAEILLILPPFGCSTTEVYKAHDKLGEPKLREADVRALTQAPLDPATLFNDLTPAAEHAQPRLADLRRRIQRAIDEPLHMSGSGSTLFIITKDPNAAATQIAQAAPEVRLLATRLI